MPLSTEEALTVARSFARYLTIGTSPCQVTKETLLSAVSALDTWLEANQVSLNNSLPASARSGLTAAQKSMLLQIVANKKYGGF